MIALLRILVWGGVFVSGMLIFVFAALMSTTTNLETMYWLQDMSMQCGYVCAVLCVSAVFFDLLQKS